MSFATKPTFVKQAFANNGIKNTIPDTTLNQGYASYDEGFPAITMQPKESGGLPPRGQDMNGILNELSQFNQYQQMGGTYGLDNNILTNGGYAKNSIVYQDDGMYRSLIDNNTDDFVNNPSVIGSTWQLIVDYNSQSGSNGVPGQFSFFGRTDIPSGWLRCDGTQYTRSEFPNFWNNYLTQNKIPTCSYADYATEISDNGNCGKFAVDLVNLTFKVPTLSDDIYITQALISGNIAKFNAESLPNIKDTLAFQTFRGNGGFRNITSSNNTLQGGDIFTGRAVYDSDSSNNNVSNEIKINASYSNSAYQDDAKVKTDRVQYPIFICVANVQVPVSEAQYNGFISNLTLKADKNGSNVDENFFTGANFTADTIDYIVESGSNANGFYKKFKSGKTIQGANNINGGTLGAGQGSQVVINLPTPTQSTNYIVNVNFDNSFVYYASMGYAVRNKTTTGFEIDQYNNANGTTGTIKYNYYQD